MSLRNGKTAFTDIVKTTIILMDRDGQVLADSIQKGVTVLRPCGIAYHPRQNCLLVCDIGGKNVTFLHPTTLRVMTKVKMAWISAPVGICVMSNGNTVVSGQGKQLIGMCSSGTVGVFDIHGTQLHPWNTYTTGVEKLIGAWYTAVDNEDNILLSDHQSKKIVKLDKTGRFLSKWPTQGEPRGLAVAGDIVLVAEEGPDCVMAYNLQGGDARLAVS